MFKKCFSTVACMDMAYKELVRKCVQFQIDGVEIRVDNDGGVCGASTASELENLKDTFDTNKISIVDLGSSACFRGYEEGMIKLAEAAVDKAAALSALGVRVFLGNFTARTDAAVLPIDYKGIVKALQELGDYAQKRSVEIWIETHNEFSTGEVLKKLLEDINRDNVKIIWDIMHPIEAGESIEETWELMGEKIAHVHIKDGYDRKDPAWNDYCYTRLGDGALPLQSILELLKNRNYEGYISLEWETAWREELKIYPSELSWILQEYTNLINNFEEKVCLND